MQPQPFEALLHWILEELKDRQAIFGIHRSLFFTPRPGNRYAIDGLFGQHLATPIGPAAGPHTQLAQNIVCAWLCGGRFIELKTVQVLDELTIPRPCIDMEDEGYNVEWSQELRLAQSAEEYIKAWALIHILHRVLGHGPSLPLGTIFNVSVGYDLEGIRDARLTRFLDQMRDASAELDTIRVVLKQRFPQFADIEIPSQVSNNVTLSTMHGCPPQEIGQIARYLMEDRGFHTSIKLNPTLLGKKTVLHMLHGNLGFNAIEIPDAVFRRDLRYPQALELIARLQRTADTCGLTFGVKLSNTLPVMNHRLTLPGNEIYMSGRSLYPLTLSLLLRLAEEFHGGLNISYSGGADAHNIGAILSAGAFPVTMATNLLKPGGCARFVQCLENVDEEMRRRGVTQLEEFRKDAVENLRQALGDALSNPRYQKDYYTGILPKVPSGLGLFDCITAPCIEQCEVRQDIPEYAWWVAGGDYDRALAVIMSRNPLPGVTGHICTQRCQSCCTRSAGNYDQPVAIRALKRFAAEHGRILLPAPEKLSHRVAIIGSGPSGLSAAYFLALNGIRATIFEARDEAGGMMRLAPEFRLSAEVLRQDVDRIVRLGVELRLSSPIQRPPEELLKDGFDAVYIASGFQKDIPLYVEGMQGPGVMPALDFLRRARRGEVRDLGSRVVVIGGGNTAFDSARMAQRLSGKTVAIVYRRTRVEMPAGDEEYEEAIAEGIVVQELTTPVRVIRNVGRVGGLVCVRNEMGPPGADGRRRPMPLPGSEFKIDADTIIAAVGQGPDISFLDGSIVRLHQDGAIEAHAETRLAHEQGIYAGGDAVRGPSSIIAACADGRRAAEAICADFGVVFQSLPRSQALLSTAELLQVRRARARREEACRVEKLAPGMRGSLELVEKTLSKAAARAEAQRCLQCSSVCDKCVEVCPNRANQTYLVEPARLTVPILACGRDGFILAGETVLHIRQSTQILHLSDLCNECGNCATFCVHQGKPYLDKPRFFSRIDNFRKENDNAFWFEKKPAGWIMRRRDQGRECRLEVRTGLGEAIFEDDRLRATFDCGNFSILGLEKHQNFAGELTLGAPAEMYIIGNGITSSLSFLP